ncbi:MAG TPA: GNAT family N-acyltransferase [Luteibaculaceae bacterium]|nr:GNAT family N-acyltransferase [Luteibaculaceae bacterium]
MKELISQEDVLNATNLHKFNMKVVAKVIMKLTGINAINKLYSDLSDKRGIFFVREFFDKLQITIQLNEKELRYIPKTGPFIVVANHPLGAIDGLMLIKLIAERRPDFRVMANFLLKNIEPIEEYFIPVNPFEDQAKSSFGGMKASLEHLKNGGGLGIFPAGEVSSYQTQSRKITDREWQRPALKLIQHAKVPIVPVYFKGNNSLLFQLLGLLHPKLRTATLASEVFKKRESTLCVRVGSQITLKDQDAFPDLLAFGRYLRAKVYSLGSADLEIKKFYQPRFLPAGKVQTVVAETPTDLLSKEIEHLEELKLRLFSQQEFDVFIAYSNEIPNILHEIGRLREITFRSVGEGTNKSIDLDEFDLYYHHLFVWDREKKCVVGAYRIGKGNDILNKFGRNGFYCSTLFSFKKGLDPVLAQTLELGRSWVREEYQLKRLPLFLLWRGIMHFLLGNREYRYILGPVSISNSYSKTSQTLIVEFVKRYYFNHDLAKLVVPNKPFKGQVKDNDIKALLENMSSDMKNLDRIIADIEPFQFSIPVLLKKYIDQNAKIIGFNVDPAFNYSLDGLMILDLADLKEESVLTFGEDFLG